MYLNLQQNQTTDFLESVYIEQQVVQRELELVRRNLHETQRRQSGICNKVVHGPTYKKGQKVLLYHPAIAVGTDTKFASPWKRPYIFEKCLNEVTFRIEEKICALDRLKRFCEPPPTSNVPTINKPRNLQSAQHVADTHKHMEHGMKC